MILLVAALLNLSAATANAATATCDYSGSWHSVDKFQLAPGGPAEARGGTEIQNAIYIVGQAQLKAAEDTPRWLVRKSVDRGVTWKTVDEFAYEGKGAVAHAIAGLARNGQLFVVGHGIDKSNHSHWLVRKSADRGLTWKTVQDLTAKEDYAAAESVAVDETGVVYVTGEVNAGSPGVSRWTTQRSADGGVSWTTVDEVAASKNASGLAVVTDKQGRVFVGGSLNDEAAFAWTVRSSPNGQKGWKTVDRFELPGGTISQATGAASRDGRIAFVGYASDTSERSHWIIRKARSSRPENWWTAEDYVSDRVRAQARPSAVAFTPDGRTVSTGRLIVSGGEFDYLFSRLGSNTTDTLQGSPTFEDKELTRGNALVVLVNGDLLMGGSLTEGQNKWLVRKLNCQGDADLHLVRSPAAEKPKATSRPGAPKRSNSASRR